VKQVQISFSRFLGTFKVEAHCHAATISRHAETLMDMFSQGFSGAACFRH
jgi:hypothetical protein